MLGESRWTIQRRVRKGELSAELIGGALILDRAEVVKLAAEVAREAAAKADHIANAIAEPVTR